MGLEGAMMPSVPFFGILGGKMGFISKVYQRRLGVASPNLKLPFQVIKS